MLVSASGVSLCFARSIAFAYHPTELRTGVHTELAVRTGEIRLHGLDADECAPGDFLICEAQTGELCDPLLGRGEARGRAT